MALARDIKDSFTTVVLKHAHDSYARFLHLELGDLLSQQERATGQRGYLFGFRAYTDKHMAVPVSNLPIADRPKVVLPVELHSEHYGWAENHARHQADFQRLSQGLTSILLRVDNLQDLRDILPDHVLGPALQHPAIQGISRSNPPLYTAPPAVWGDAHWGAKPMELYATIGPLLETYLGYTLL